MKLIFDANVSPVAVKALEEFLKKTREECEVRHLTDDFPQSAPDSGFVKTYAEKDFLLITGDSAKQSGRKDRLPAICRAEGLRHVLFTGRLQQKRTFDKMRAVISLWPQLKEASVSPRGSRFKLQQHQKNFTVHAAS